MNSELVVQTLELFGNTFYQNNVFMFDWFMEYVNDSIAKSVNANTLSNFGKRLFDLYDIISEEYDEYRKQSDDCDKTCTTCSCFEVFYLLKNEAVYN